MPPLGEHGLRPDVPAGASRPGSRRRSLSPRMHAADFGEQIVESGYAAAYPGGSTSWLRIESQLQHLEELVTLPEVEGGGGPSTLLVEGRRETSEVAELELDSLVRAELVLIDEPTPTPKANSATKPPQAPRTPRTQVAPLYSSGSRKRSLGLGRVDYVTEANTPAAAGGGGPTRRVHRSSRSPSPGTHMPRSWQADNAHAQKVAQRESADEAEELKNLRDWNHTLSYELSIERNELHDVKRQLAALREQLQRTKSARDADAHEIESLRRWNHTLSHEVEEERRKNETLNNEADAWLAEVAQLREKLSVALLEVEKNKDHASEVTDKSRSKDELAKQQIRLLQERLREADEDAKQNICLLQERLREADEDATQSLSLLQEKIRVAEQTAQARIAHHVQTARENTHTVVELRRTTEHLEETKRASQRAIAEAERASQGAIAEVRLQQSITEKKFAQRLDHGRWTTELVLRMVARRSKTVIFFEWKTLVASLYVRQSILKYAIGHVHRFLKKRIWKRWKSRTNVWRRELRSHRVAFEAFVKQCYRTIVLCFSAWKHLRGEKRRAQDRVLKIVFKGLFFSVSKAWNTWVDTIREKKRLRLAGIRTMRKWMMQSTLPPFRTWLAFTIDNRRLRRAGLQVVQRLTHMLAWRTIDKWIWLTKERKRLAAAEAKVVKRLFNFGLWKAFDTWMCRIKRAKQLGKAAVSVLNKWRQSCLWRAMQTWEDVTREHKRITLSAVKSLKHWLRYSTWKAFDSWQEALHRSKNEAEKQRMALMLQTKTLRRWWATGLFAAFNEWAFKVRDNRRIANAAMRVIKGWVLRKSLAAFHSWREAWQQAQRVAHVKRKVLRRMQLKIVWAAFDKWETVLEEARREGKRQQALVQLQTRVVRRIRAMAAWKALDKWQYVAKQRKTIDEMKAKVLGKMRHAGLWSAVHSWVDKVRESKRLAKMLSRVIRIWMSKSIVGTMHKWLDVVDRSRRARKLRMAVVTRWTMASMWQSFDTWHLCTHQSKRQRILLDKIIQRWANAAVVGAFDTWAGVAALHSEQRQSATKILARWRHADVLGAFAGWLENVHTAQQSRVFLSRAIRRWVNVNLSKCWRAWIGAVVDMKRQDYLRTRSLQRWTKTPLFRTFNLFKEHVLCALRQRNLMARIARRWMMVAFIGAWDTWVDVTTRSIKIKVIARKVIQRWCLNSLVGAWNLWTEIVSTALRIRVVCSKALRRWREQRLSEAFERWRDSTKDAKRLRSVGSRVVLRWTLRLKSSAFYGYLDATKRQAKIFAKASISIQRWGHSILYHALQGWLHGAREQMRLFGVATKIVSRWTRLSLSEAWNGWKYGTQDQKRLVNISSRIMRRWFELRVSSAFQAWIWFVFDSLGGQVRTNSHQNLDKLMARIVKRMRMALSGKAFDSWRFVAQKQAKIFRLFNATLARLKNRLAFAAFNSWRENALEERRLRVLATQVVKKWVMGSLAAAIDGWKEHAVEQRRLRVLATRVMTKWVMGSLAAAIEGWRARTTEQRRLKKKAQKTIRRWMNSSRAAAFHHWRDHAMQQLRLTRTAAGVVLRWRSRALAQAFLRWDDNVRWMVKSKGILTRSLARWYDRLLYSAWHTWVLNAQKSQMEATSVARVVIRWKTNDIARAFLGWSSRMHEAKKLRQRMTAALSRWFALRLNAAFNQWEAETARLKRYREALVQSLQVWQQPCVGRAWNQWKLQQSQSAHFRAVGGKIIQRMLHYKLSLGFFTWQSRVADMKRMFAITQRVLRRWMFHTLSLAWDLWNEFVSQVQQEREAEYSEVEKRLSYHRSQTAIGIVHEHFQTAIRNLINRLDKTRLFKHLWVWRMHSSFVYEKSVDAINRALYKLNGGNSAKAFDAWQYGVARTKQIRTQCTRIITRMLHFTASRAYDRWCQFAAQRVLVRHAARRWLLRTLVAAFEAWCRWFYEECARNVESSKQLATASKKQRCAAKVELVLDMEFDHIAGHEEGFMEYFINDVAGAVNADPTSFHVLGLQPGSIIVKLGLEDEEGIPAMSRARAIEQQAKDPQSALRKHENTFSGRLARAAVVKDKNWWKWRDKDRCTATLQRLLHNQAHYFRIPMSSWCFDQWRSVVKGRALEDKLAHLEASIKKMATDRELDVSTAVKIELLFFGLDDFGGREFEDALIQDIAGALDGTPEKIRILRIHYPSLTLGLAEGVCGHHKGAMHVAHELVRQVHDPQSPLKHPSYTHYSPKIQAAKILVGDVSVITTRYLNTCKRTVTRMLHIGLAVAFDGFCERVLEIRKKKSRVKHIIQRMQHLNLAAAFDRFQEGVGRLKRQHVIIARTIAKWKTPVLEACWNGWLDVCDERRYVRHEEAHEMAKLKLVDHIQEAALCRSEYMKRFLRMWEKRPMLSALHKWIYTVCSIKTARRAIRRMQRLKLAAAFCRLCESVRILENRRRIILSALAKWRMPLLACCMHEWMSAVDEAKQEAKEEAFKLACAELQQQEVEDNEIASIQLPGHVGSLIEVDVQKEEYHLTDAEILQLDLQQQVAEERARYLDRCARTVKRMLHIGLAVAFDGFCERVLEIRKKKARVKHIIRRMQHLNLAAAFDRFHEVVGRLKRQHAVIARTLGRWTRSPVELCFSEWLRYVDDGKVVAAEIAYQRLEAQLAEQMTPGHPEGEGEATSMQANMREEADSLIEVDVQKEEYYLTDFEILQLDVQQQVEEERARYLDRCARTVKRMLHIGLAVAFDGFCERVLEIRKKKARVKHIIRRMQHLNLAAAFDRFHEVVGRLKRQHAVIARTLGRWTRSPVELCFSEWLRYVDDGKVVAAEIAYQRLEAQLAEHVDKRLQKKEGHITRLLRMWREMPKHRAWNAWCHMHNVMMQCKRALCRMRNIQLASAFEAFHEAVDRLKRLHEAVSRAIAVWRRPGVEWCFELWVQFVDDVRTEAQTAAHEFTRSRIESAFVGQAEKTTELGDHVAMLLKNQQESRNKLIQRVLTRMTHLRLAAAFDLFHEEADQRRRRRQIITRCLGRWRAPLLEWGWEHWLVCVADSRRAAAEAARNSEEQKLSEQRKAEYCLAKCLSLWLNRCYTRAFHTWLAVCQHSRRIHFVGSRAVRRIFWHTSARCFGHWLDIVLNLKATRGRMMRYLRLWIRRQLKSAFFTWAENAMDLVEAKVTVLQQQQEYQKNERRLDATAVKIVHRNLCRLLHFALLRWYQETVEIGNFIGAARRIVQRWQQAARREMLKRWVAGADVQQTCRRRWRSLVAMRSLLALQELAVGILDIAGSDPNGHFAFDQQAPLSTHTARIHAKVPPTDGLPQARGPNRARYVERSDEWDEVSEENLEWETVEEEEETYDNEYQVQGVML